METGAMALFGEKYGDEVRVDAMGTALEGDKTGKPYSVELCGGTHVQRTGDIGLIRVVGEAAVAAGVRRLEALTGDEARNYLVAQDGRVRNVADMLKSRPDDIVDRVKALLEERKKLERELSDAKRKAALGGSGNGTDSGAPKAIAGVNFIGRVLQGVEPKDLRGIVDDAKSQIGSGVAAVVGVSDEGKAGVVVGVTKDLSGKISAVDLVRAGADAVGGKGGGGRPDMAQAGGPNGASADAAISAIEEKLQSLAG